MHKRVAELQMETNDKFSAATSYQAAFQAYKKDDGCVNVAVECLNQAIELHINNGKFTQAAKFHKEAGELFESELNYQKAIDHFQVAPLNRSHPNLPGESECLLLPPAPSPLSL